MEYMPNKGVLQWHQVEHLLGRREPAHFRNNWLKEPHLSNTFQ